MEQKLNICIAGGAGFIGERLYRMFTNNGYLVKVLTRDKKKINQYPNKYVYWNPSKGEMDSSAFEQLDILINLTGAGIAEKKWTSSRKQLLESSRVETTQFLLECVTKNKQKLTQYIGASAIGIYGNSGENEVQEIDISDSESFLVELSKKWEHVHTRFKTLAKQVTIIRISTVLGKNDGAYPKFVFPLRFFLATIFGHGRQYVSWIHIEDLSRLFLFLIKKQRDGLFNASAPESISFRGFMKTAAQVHNKWAVPVKLPAWLLRFIFGEMSQLFLNSNRVNSEKIQNAGFKFKYPSLRAAIREIEGEK